MLFCFKTDFITFAYMCLLTVRRASARQAAPSYLVGTYTHLRSIRLLVRTRSASFFYVNMSFYISNTVYTKNENKWPGWESNQGRVGVTEHDRGAQPLSQVVTPTFQFRLLVMWFHDIMISIHVLCILCLVACYVQG
jgi:hypothetical protein